MTGYAPNLLDTLRISLEEEKKSLVLRIRDLTLQDPFSDPERLNDNAASDAEAFEESNHDRVSAQIDELKGQLSATDDALVRIGNGTYGFCSNCKEMIDTDRLAILPTATLCLDCERKKRK